MDIAVASVRVIIGQILQCSSSPSTLAKLFVRGLTQKWTHYRSGTVQIYTDFESYMAFCSRL